VLKKYSAMFLSILLLFGCAVKQQKIDPSGSVRYSGFSSEVEKFDGFKAAMLLPLSGKLSKQGEGLQNATLLAINELDDKNIVIDFFDTQSSPDGAAKAARGAVAQGANIIIGPLTSDEVEAVTPLAKSERIPVVSFSTSPRVLQNGIYSLGLLSEEQIYTIMKFATDKGRKNFAILVPDNNYGMGLAKAAYRSAKINRVNLIKIGFYAPDSIDFSQLLSDMTDYKKRSERADNLKKSAERRLENGDESAAADLQRMKNVDSIGGVDFDAIIIPESGAKLKSAASMLGYYDVFAPEVMMLGTATWDNTNLSRETTLYGSFYPALSKEHSSYLFDKYQKTFSQNPESLYSFAYDAVALLSELGKSENSSVSARLLDEHGFSGLNGSFKFFADGTNSHNLKIFEVTAKGPKEVFADENQERVYEYIPADESLPVVYGKDSDEVLRFIQINL